MSKSLFNRLVIGLRDMYHRALPIETRKKLRLARLLPFKPSAPPPPRHFAPVPPPPPLSPLGVNPKIAIVIPNYNRLEHLKICVDYLTKQTMNEFVVLIADDGSTDSTAAWVDELRQQPFWSNRLLFINCGEHQGARSGRARNLVIATLSNIFWLVVSLDSDVLLHPSALATYIEWYSVHPNSILAGRMEWLPPMELTEVQQVLNTAGFDGLQQKIDRNLPLDRVPWTLIGPEFRSTEGLVFVDQPADAESKVIQRRWVLPGNMAYPPRLHWVVEGYDEQIRGYGYDDLDFAERLGAEGIEMVGVGPAVGLHIFHLKNEGSGLHALEAQRNLDYLIRKYQQKGYPASVVDYYVSHVDWHYWWHYNRERGAEIVSPDGVLWAINAARTHRLQLPDAQWVTALGFAAHEVHLIAPSELEAFENVGLAADPIGDGLDYLPPPKK